MSDVLFLMVARVGVVSLAVDAVLNNNSVIQIQGACGIALGKWGLILLLGLVGYAIHFFYALGIRFCVELDYGFDKTEGNCSW